VYKSLVVSALLVLGLSAVAQAQPYPVQPVLPQPPVKVYYRGTTILLGGGPALTSSGYQPGQPSLGQPGIGQPQLDQPQPGQPQPGQPQVGQPQVGQPPMGQPVPAVVADPPTGQPEPRVKLYYRPCSHEPWRYAGCYECIHDAEDAAKPMQAAGYQVYFRNCR